MIILDTNVVSELMRPRADERVVSWVAAHPATRLYTTSVSEAEVLLGVHLLPEGRRRDAMTLVARAVFERVFAGRVLAFGRESANAYALLVAERRRLGRPINAMDGMIAAITRAVGATIATRNVDDFELCGIDVVNPFA